MTWRWCRDWRVDLLPDGVALDDYNTPVLGEVSRDKDAWVALVLGEELVSATVRHPSPSAATDELAVKLSRALPPLEM